MEAKSVSVAQPVTPVGILAGKLQSLVHAAAAIPELNAEFHAQLDEVLKLAEGFEPYVDACTSPPSQALAELAKRTAEEDWPGRFEQGATDLPLEQEMLSGNTEGHFLQFLIRLSGAKRVLEIGLFTGCSALAIAEALPADGNITSIEYDAYAAKFAKRCLDESPHGTKIDVLVGPARDVLNDLASQGKQYDFVFIDADKTGYLNYLTTLLGTSSRSSGLLTDDALICVDNTLLQGKPYLDDQSDNAVAIREFNKAVVSDPTLRQVLIPIRDGVTLIQRVADSASN